MTARDPAGPRNPTVTGTPGTDQPGNVPVRPAAPRHSRPPQGGQAARPGVTPAVLKLARAMTESQLQTLITTGPSRREPGLCKQLGLRFYFTHDSRHSPGGFPDLVIVGSAGGVFWELKKEGERPTSAQQEWLAALAFAGFTAAVRYPSDYYSGRCARELAAIAGRRVA